jgi:hypothetical protein
LKGREGKGNATLCRCACRFRCHIPSLGKQEGYTSVIEEFESLQVVGDARQRSTRIFIVVGSPRNARKPWIHLSFLHRLPSCEVLTGSTARRCESIAPHIKLVFLEVLRESITEAVFNIELHRHFGRSLSGLPRRPGELRGKGFRVPHTCTRITLKGFTGASGSLGLVWALTNLINLIN